LFLIYVIGKFGLGESLLPCKVEEDHHTEQGFMAGIRVTYQPVVLESNRSPCLEIEEGPPGELTPCWVLVGWFRKLTK